MSPDPDTDAPARRRGRPPSGGREAVLAAALAILRERGAGRLTTREVAVRAGVSEGSVFYHFTDRSGLLLAVIEAGIGALRPVQEAGEPGIAPAESLTRFAAGVESFLDTGLTVIVAAQSDADLRQGLITHLRAGNLGPHRGVEALTGYLRTYQRQGVVRDDVDAEVLAFLFFGACFQRIFLTLALDDTTHAPTRSALITTMSTLLLPAPPHTEEG